MYQKREMRKNKKMDENTKSLPSTSINWYPGHMAKTKREINRRKKYLVSFDVDNYIDDFINIYTNNYGINHNRTTIYQKHIQTFQVRNE